MMEQTFEPTTSFWRDKRVFVTGHTGFKGSWMTLLLTALGAEVRGYALQPQTNPSMFHALALECMCDSVIADIRDGTRLATALREFAPDVAIHMAAQPLVRRSYKEPIETFEVNVQGTVNFLEACRGVASIRSVVVVTTDKCYENHGDSRPYGEDEPLGGHDPYSASKACAEIVTQAYRLSFFSGPSPIGISSARAGNVFGGGDWSEDRLIPDIMRMFAAGRPAIIRNPSAIRPWQHVAAPTVGYLMLAQALWHDPRAYSIPFNFGPDPENQYCVDQVAKLIANSWQGDAALEVRSDANAPHEAAVLLLDPARARKRLGWAAPQDLMSALAATTYWYKQFYSGATAQQLRDLTLTQLRELSPIRTPEIAAGT
jgi:CDP-glucose 4,6-dehydratase